MDEKRPLAICAWSDHAKILTPQLNFNDAFTHTSYVFLCHYILMSIPTEELLIIYIYIYIYIYIFPYYILCIARYSS